MKKPTWFNYILDAFKTTGNWRSREQLRNAIGCIWEASNEVRVCLGQQALGVATARQASEAMKEMETAYNSLFLASGRAAHFAFVAASAIHYEYSEEWWNECAPHTPEFKAMFEKAQAKRREIAEAILGKWQNESVKKDTETDHNEKMIQSVSDLHSTLGKHS